MSTPLPNLTRELESCYPDLVVNAELDNCWPDHRLCQRIMFEGTLKQLRGYGLLNRKPHKYRGGAVKHTYSDFGATGHCLAHGNDSNKKKHRVFHFLAVDPDQDEERVTKRAQQEALKIIRRLQRTVRTAAP